MREPKLLYVYVYEGGRPLPQHGEITRPRNGMSRSEAGKLGAKARWGKRRQS